MLLLLIENNASELDVKHSCRINHIHIRRKMNINSFLQEINAADTPKLTLSFGEQATAITPKMWREVCQKLKQCQCLVDLTIVSLPISGPRKLSTKQIDNLF